MSAVEVNAQGLPRKVPPAIKREIRKRCGFGCVVCGSSIYQYEHVVPTFADATTHDPTRMALLCGTHHDLVTRGMWSKEKVKQAMLAPAALARGFASSWFDFVEHPAIVFGGMTLSRCRVPIEVRKEPLFLVDVPEEPKAPFRLTAHFFNSRGERSVDIIENEWQALTSNWDVEVVGAMITIRDEHKKLSLRLRADPPKAIIVEHLDMYLHGYHFTANAETLNIANPGGGASSFTRGLTRDCDVGMSLG
jgi:hypothetical protein